MCRIVLYIAHQYVKMFCNTEQLPALPFCVPHSKPHGARGLNKHYHLSFYPKLGNDVCSIISIPCACVACTSMLDKPWISGILYKKITLKTSHQFHLLDSPRVIKKMEHHPIVT